ncbi:MAG: hypothetical protein Kow0068_25010 [Marinilabiliales bacterium]
MFFFPISVILAGNDNLPIGARSVGMGNSSVMIYDVWSAHQNQAGLARLTNIELGFSHENRFLSDKLGYQAFVIAVPTNSGTFSAEINYFGYSSYNESKIGIGYGKKLLDKLSIGIQLDYINNYIADIYGNAGNVAAEVGILAEPYENFFIGAHVFNPTKSKIADYNEERIPTIIKFGMGYKFSDKLIISCETEKDLDYKPSYKAGVEFMVKENVFVRGGVMVLNSYQNTNTFRSCFGIGYVLSGFHADLAFSTDPILGLTPHVSVSYRFNKSLIKNE